MGESSKIMGNSNNKDYLKWGITLFLVILGGLVSYYIIFHIDSLSSTIRGIFAILMPIIDGLILAYLLTPLVNTMERRILKPFFSLIKVDIKKSHRRILSLFITDSVVLVGIYIFFSNVIPQIANSIRTIVEQFPSYVDTLTVWISQLHGVSLDLCEYIHFSPMFPNENVQKRLILDLQLRKSHELRADNLFLKFPP